MCCRPFLPVSSAPALGIITGSLDHAIVTPLGNMGVVVKHLSTVGKISLLACLPTTSNG